MPTHPAPLHALPETTLSACLPFGWSDCARCNGLGRICSRKRCARPQRTWPYARAAHCSPPDWRHCIGTECERCPVCFPALAQWRATVAVS